MSEAPTTPMDLLPIGPFPPVGNEASGGVDLGVRLRDQLYRGEVFEGTVRGALLGRLERAAQAGPGIATAELLQAYVDSWPVAALVDDARVTWTAGADGTALAVLGRAAELLRLATGWPLLGEGPWPMPDARWLGAQVGDRPLRLLTRCEHDGSEAIAESLGVEVAGRAPAPLPPIAQVQGHDLVARRAELGRSLARGEHVAVRLISPVPDTPEAHLALGEMALEGAAQHAFGRYGVAGAMVGSAPAWTDLLQPAPPGRPGPIVRPRCDTALLFGTPEGVAGGKLEVAGWLLWPGPHPPIPVHPAAVALLRELEGAGDVRAVAATHGLPVEGVEALLNQLLELGAASA